MHLLLAQQGSLSDVGDEAIDLGQSAGDICFLSAADTDLAVVAAARSRMPAGAHTVRLANLMQLKHPMSIDTWVERTGRHAKLVIARLLGGYSYWSYAVEALRAAAEQFGFKLAFLPGDEKADPTLEPWSTVEPDVCAALSALLSEGGPDNARRFLESCADVITGRSVSGQAAPLLRAGAYPYALCKDLPDDALTVAIVFYRALVQSGQTSPIDALGSALADRGVRPIPIYVSSLKDAVSQATVLRLFEDRAPDVVINLTGFAVSAPGADRAPTVLESGGAVVLQAVLSSSPVTQWEKSAQGLSSRDLAMGVALPEVDGRVFTRAISFKGVETFNEQVECNIVTHVPRPDRVAFVADLAIKWGQLRRHAVPEKRPAIILANYPNRDGRLANGVGLDTPAGTIEVLRAMANVGYKCGSIPADADALMDHLKRGPTNAVSDARETREAVSLKEYKTFLDSLPIEIQNQLVERWGEPERDPFFRDGQFCLPLTRFGNVLVGIQPARGYNIDPKETYHAPDLVPPHGYMAFYAYLRQQADAVIHMGKHGNLEWLPGKALSLTQLCYPEAALGPMPHIYPFIVNDPGEGTQAKRRSAAVIIDHLTPPLTRAETYGPLKDLEALVDEYYDAAGSDPRRLRLLKTRILDLVRDIGLDHDAGISSADETDAALEKLDAYLCDLKEMQIRDGLHVFGRAPEGGMLLDLVTALARVPRGLGEGGDASLQRAIAADLALVFDPLDCAMAAPWDDARPQPLADVSSDPWRTNGDTVERIELLATELVSNRVACQPNWHRTRAVLEAVEKSLLPSVTRCGRAEIEGLLAALGGRFVAPGPSGAPTRGRPDVLPTGRNFFSVDSRAVPTETAWELGRRSADLLVTRYVQDHGDWPTSFALTAWGTSNMRTGGDDIAQAMALIGVQPVWDGASRRVTGYSIIAPSALGRPRVDVTLRISGFFRDAFPDQIALFDRAVRAVAALDEEDTHNPIAVRARVDREKLIAAGLDNQAAEAAATYRVFGSKPGAYGAGLQALIDENGWTDRADLAEAFLVWGGYAYGEKADGELARDAFVTRLKTVDAVIQNQDNREHDLLDSDDYYQFEGGMTAAVSHVSGTKPANYHNDHSRPERPVIRTLEDEIGRIVRARVVNPKWIAGVMRHGYKGAFEMAATVDYMFAFAATTGAVRDHHFEAVYQAYLVDEPVRDFIADKNPDALREMAARLYEAIDRGLWTPRSNSAKFDLEKLSHDSGRP